MIMFFVLTLQNYILTILTHVPWTHWAMIGLLSLALMTLLLIRKRCTVYGAVALGITVFIGLFLLDAAVVIRYYGIMHHSTGYNLSLDYSRLLRKDDFGPAEIVSNIAVFVPFGFFLSEFLLVVKRYSASPRFVLVILIAFGLSFCIECLQLVLHVGFFEMTDLMMNMFGSVLGASLTQVVRPKYGLIKKSVVTNPKIYVIILFLLIGCTKTDVYYGDEANCLRDNLTALLKENITIDNYQQKGDIFYFSFSNGAEIGIKDTVAPVLTLGIQGYWRCNGLLTDVLLDSEDVHSLLSKEGVVLGVIEGFEDWAFYFSDEEVISFRKTLFMFNPDSRVRGVNHRGYSIDAPENTLPAFRLSKLCGFHYVEADIDFTMDDVPVLIHDATVDRTSNGSGLVSMLSFDELRDLDFGAWKSSDFTGTKIPSLKEFLILCRDIDLLPYLELKNGTRSQVESVIALVEEYGLQDKVTYISFSPTILRYIVDFEPKAAIGLLTSTISDIGIQTAIGLRTDLNYVFIDTSDYSDGSVAMCRNASLPMEVWTIDSRSVIKSLSPYISGVTSNRYHAGRVMEEQYQPVG